jgi:hypothetical protein
MQVKQFSSRYDTTKATDKQISPRQQQSYQKEYREKEYVYLNQVKKVNGRQKYRKITKSLFWVYSHEHKEVRKRKEEKTLTK